MDAAPREPAALADDVTLRPLTTDDDLAACLEVQRATWGRDFGEAVPGSLLKVAQKVGGVAAGAFDRGGRLLGFVFGLTGVKGGRLVHWSHMLGVLPAARDLGLGTRLKLYQRELLLPLSVESVYWTFDPLEARNAHLNLNRLGAEVAEYVEEMYAGEMGSELAHGIGTDRFVVEWRIASDRVRRALSGEREDLSRFADAPIINEDGQVPAFPDEAPAFPADGQKDPLGHGAAVPDLPLLRVEIPATIQALKAERPEEARAWRAGTRLAFEHSLARGYRVAGLARDATTGRCFYGLETAETPREEAP